FDFSGYKRTTLYRRLAKRMSQVGAADYKAYLEYLQLHQEEFAALFNTILINVTGYFRDAPAWDYLQRDILPRIIAGKEKYEPISRIDLLICRNTLMYFESEAQAKILARLHYALNENGYLFLGKAEMLLSRDALFTPVELKNRVFTKVPKASLRERLLVLAQAGNVDMGNQLTRQGRLREVVADTLPLAHLVVDAGGYLTSINQRARSLFGL